MRRAGSAGVPDGEDTGVGLVVVGDGGEDAAGGVLEGVGAGTTGEEGTLAKLSSDTCGVTTSRQGRALRGRTSGARARLDDDGGAARDAEAECLLLAAAAARDGELATLRGRCEPPVHVVVVRFASVERHARAAPLLSEVESERSAPAEEGEERRRKGGEDRKRRQEKVPRQVGRRATNDMQVQIPSIGVCRRSSDDVRNGSGIEARPERSLLDDKVTGPSSSARSKAPVRTARTVVVPVPAPVSRMYSSQQHGTCARWRELLTVRLERSATIYLPCARMLVPWLLGLLAVHICAAAASFESPILREDSDCDFALGKHPNPTQSSDRV